MEHGGRGLSVAHRVAFYEEYARADAPDKVNHLGEELLGPTLIAYGTPEQQQRFLPKILDVDRAVVPGLLGARRRLRPGQRVDDRPNSTATSG